MTSSSSFLGSPGGQIQETYVVPQEPALASLKIREYLNNISYALNRKDSGYYVSDVTITGQQFLPTFSTTSNSSVVYRPVLRVVVDFGALPNTTSQAVAHGIPGIGSTFSGTRIYGAATNPTTNSWIPIPYASPTLANNIQLDVDATNVTITTGSDRTAYTRCFVVVEYITTI